MVLVTTPATKNAQARLDFATPNPDQQPDELELLISIPATRTSTASWLRLRFTGAGDLATLSAALAAVETAARLPEFDGDCTECGQPVILRHPSYDWHHADGDLNHPSHAARPSHVRLRG